MQGLELSELYYETYGKAMIAEQFADAAERIAVGLVGSGSECMGFDDDISRDHDFEPGFCLWITREDERDFGFRLERAYAKLPREFQGLKRQLLSPVGGSRHGVMVIDDFYQNFLGAANAPDSVERWLYTPSESLACACNGKVFRDDLGVFSAVRQVLLQGYPEDIRRKKLAAHTALMAQAGQYNYTRCLSRGEHGAAQLAIFQFVDHAISAIYLLNNRYRPFYKWAYRGMRELPRLARLENALTGLTELNNEELEASVKQETIEEVASLFIEEFQAQGLTQAICGDLEKHAYSILDTVRDPSLRNMHIMTGA